MDHLRLFAEKVTTLANQSVNRPPDPGGSDKRRCILPCDGLFATLGKASEQFELDLVLVTTGMDFSALAWLKTENWS